MNHTLDLIAINLLPHVFLHILNFISLFRPLSLHAVYGAMDVQLRCGAAIYCEAT